MNDFDAFYFILNRLNNDQKETMVVFSEVCLFVELFGNVVFVGLGVGVGVGVVVVVVVVAVVVVVVGGGASGNSAQTKNFQ